MPSFMNQQLADGHSLGKYFIFKDSPFEAHLTQLKCKIRTPEAKSLSRKLSLE